ncbi:MAG: trypsin-like peptidase domain-containing protein [Gallionella sp.]|nr:trypsin-like peptidase domain-containing protein [Gallionella sp.]
MRATGKLFLILMFVTAVGACSESSPPLSKQEAALPAENRLAQLQKQADSGDADAQFNLGVMYRKGEGVPKDANKAVEWWQKAAAQGYAKAQYSLGWMYYNGVGVPKDTTKAVEWYQKAATQGNASAQINLGEIYLGKDNAKAVDWFQKAATQGDADAQYMLGTMYSSGLGVSKDAAKAIEWYLKAATQGNANAQYSLGLIYDNGEGVPKDAAKAVEWYQKAAAQGDASVYDSLPVEFRPTTRAQFNLGVMYRDGEGVPKDVAKAVEWFQKAAAQGHPKAQAVLGAAYYKGEGAPKDWVLAYAWFNLAAAQGKETAKLAKRLRDVLTLNSTQCAEAERLSSNWKLGQVLQREGESAADAGGAASGGGPLAKKGTGTAFVVSTEGYAVTNHHVVAGCKELRVQGRSDSIQLITRDAVSDLALLKMPGETRAVATLAPDPASLRQGQDIVVFGFPLDSVLSSGGNLTPGVVSAITGLGNNSNQIQITAPIQPGSSGSPVMDKKGHVVGVVSMKLSDSAMAKATGSLPQNVNFAISGQTLKAFLDANRVPYKTGGSFFAREKSLADLGDEARKWTTVVECWK